MKRFLMLFEAHRSLETILSEKSIEIVHLRSRVEQLEKQLTAAHDEHKKDLRSVADAEAYQLTRRKVFAKDEDEQQFTPGETELVPHGPRMTARAQVRKAQQKFADQIRQFGSSPA